MRVISENIINTPNFVHTICNGMRLLLKNTDKFFYGFDNKISPNSEIK